MEQYRQRADDPPEVEWRFYDLRGFKRNESGELRDDVDDGKDDDLEAELRERFEAAQQAGVSGIPTFVYEGHAARGAIPPHQFERLVEGTN